MLISVNVRSLQIVILKFQETFAVRLPHNSKMESTLFVPEKLTFSENLRCLNLPLLVGALSQKRSLSLTCFVFAGQNVHSGKFKHLKYSENDKFSGTNSVDSILVFIHF